MAYLNLVVMSVRYVGSICNNVNNGFRFYLCSDLSNKLKILTLYPNHFLLPESQWKSSQESSRNRIDRIEIQYIRTAARSIATSPMPLFSVNDRKLVGKSVCYIQKSNGDRNFMFQNKIQGVMGDFVVCLNSFIYVANKHIRYLPISFQITQNSLQLSSCLVLIFLLENQSSCNLLIYILQFEK